MTTQPRGLSASLAQAMPVPPAQTLRLCQACPHRGGPCLPGLHLVQRLMAARALAAPTDPGFELSGSFEAETCVQPCHLLWRATAQGTWVFGGVAPEADLDALVIATDRQEQAWHPAALPGTCAALVLRAGTLS